MTTGMTTGLSSKPNLTPQVPVTGPITAAQAQDFTGIKAIVYGPAGVGKTTLCGTAEKPIILSCENGLLPLRGRDDILVFPIKTVADIRNAFSWLTTPEAKQKVKTVCLDSVTEIAEVILSDCAEKYKDNRQAYAELFKKTIQIIKAFRDLPYYHVILVAQEETMRDDLGRMYAGPCFPGQKLGNRSPYQVDLVMRLAMAKDVKTGNFYRYLQTQPTTEATAKDRSGLLSPSETPDFQAIVSKIMSGTNIASNVA